jgi:iron-sulfur cluster repair protein YtfE (RIC family)
MTAINANRRGITMKTDAQEIHAIESVSGTGRVDLYNSIHKALRAWMGHTLTRVGQMDPTDAEECRAVVTEVNELLGAMLAHLQTENTWVHPAILTRHPNALVEIQEDHAAHEQSIEHLRGLAASVVSSPASQTTAVAQQLYAALAVFFGENLEHMQIEETYNNQLLWLAYSDTELLEIHRSILGSMSPVKMADVLRWMIPAITAPARATMLAEMQAGMPAQAFDGFLALAHARLSTGNWTKLTMALNLPQVPGLVDLSQH